MFALAGRSEELPTLNGASATMVTHVLATDLDEHTGTVTGPGHIDGLDLPISARAVEQLCCANGIQPVTISTDGAILRLGSTERCFTRTQRRALAARDGGCIICGIPPQYTEAHHVIPWAIVHTTHVSNGVLLCWYHHRTITTSGWKIRMIDGHPEIMPPPALGPQTWRPARGSPTRQTDALRRRLRN